MERENESGEQTHKIWKIFVLPIFQIIVGIIILNVLTFFFRSITQLILSALAVEQSTIRSTIVFIVRSITVYYIYVLFVRIFEKRKADEFTIDRKSLSQFALGSVLGILTIAIIITVLWIFEYFSIVSTNDSPTIYEDIMFHSFFAFIQDVVFIAILFRILEGSYGTCLSMAAASVIFGFQHLLYPGQTLWSASAQIIEAGILFCSLFILTRRIWIVFGFHFVWNFIQYAIIGFPVMEHSRPLFVSQFSGPDIITGYPVGLEASLLTFVVTTGLGLFFLRKAFVLKNFIKPGWKRYT